MEKCWKNCFFNVIILLRIKPGSLIAKYKYIFKSVGGCFNYITKNPKTKPQQVIIFSNKILTLLSTKTKI